MVDALIGAVFAGLIGGLVSWLVVVWQFRKQRTDRIADAKFDLLKRIVREKSGGSNFSLALNEVPVIFADDEIALQLYEELIFSLGKGTQDECLMKLVTYLARRVGLPVKRELLAGGFSTGP